METAHTRRLRVAIVVQSELVPQWIEALAARLRAARTIDLDVLVVGGTRRWRLERGARALRRQLEARLLRGARDALRPVRLPSNLVSPYAARELDVVIDFSRGERSELVDVSRYGVWRAACGPSSGPAGAKGALPLYRTSIVAELSSGRRILVYESFGAIDPASRYRTRNQALWKAVGAFCHRLETVRRLGSAFLDSCPDGTDFEHAPAGEPTRAVARAVASGAGIALRRVNSVRRREAWFIAARPRNDGRPTVFESTAGFVPLEESTAASVADPFVFDHDDTTYVFFECDPHSAERAHIAYVRLDEIGRRSGPPAPALTAPYHVSYPHVFGHEDAIYMLVESSANATVEVYRAVAFPNQWTRAHVLLEGVRAFDPTLHRRAGRMWLFVGVAEHGAAPNDELHIYSSTSLRGPWEPHPLNPVVTDVRRARPAGRIFERNGDLFRPSQDCSRRYGFAIVLNRIDVLDDMSYSETPVHTIGPTWCPDLVATHTYNFSSRVEVMDGKRIVRRRLSELVGVR